MLQGSSLAAWLICLWGHKNSSVWFWEVVSGSFLFLDWSLTGFQGHRKGWRDPLFQLCFRLSSLGQKDCLWPYRFLLPFSLFLWFSTAQPSRVVPCDSTFFSVLAHFLLSWRELWLSRRYAGSVIHAGQLVWCKSKLGSMCVARGCGGGCVRACFLPAVVACCRKDMTGLNPLARWILTSASSRDTIFLKLRKLQLLPYSGKSSRILVVSVCVKMVQIVGDTNQQFCVINNTKTTLVLFISNKNVKVFYASRIWKDTPKTNILLIPDKMSLTLVHCPYIWPVYPECLTLIKNKHASQCQRKRKCYR